MVVTTISGGAHPEIEQTLPITALLISEHMTVQGETNTQLIFVILTDVTLWAHMVVKVPCWGSTPRNRAEMADYGTPDVVEGFSPEHMTVQGKTLPQHTSGISTNVTHWTHMVGETILGGAHPEIEPKWLIMALQNHEHMTLRGKSH